MVLAAIGVNGLDIHDCEDIFEEYLTVGGCSCHVQSTHFNPLLTHAHSEFFSKVNIFKTVALSVKVLIIIRKPKYFGLEYLNIPNYKVYIPIRFYFNIFNVKPLH